MQDLKEETFHDRLNKVVKEIKVSEFSKRSGISVQLLYRYLNGMKPGVDVLAAMARAAECSLDWLVLGSDAPPSPYSPVPHIVFRQGFVMLGPPHRPGVAFRLEELENLYGHGPYRTATVTGPSMAPTLTDGSLVLVMVDSNASSPVDGLLYMFHYEGLFMAREIRRPRPGKWVAVAHAPGYDPLEMSDDDLIESVLGRIVWAGKYL